LHPGRRGPLVPGEEVEGRADAELDAVDAATMFESELFLLRAADSEKDQAGARVVDPLDHRSILCRCERSKGRRFRPGDLETGESFHEDIPKTGQDLRMTAVQVDGNAFPGRARAQTPHELRAIDAVAQLRAMEPVECPTHRLPVGYDEVELVDSRTKDRVSTEGGETVEGHVIYDPRNSDLRRLNDPVQRIVIVGGADVDPEDAVLPWPLRLLDWEAQRLRSLGHRSTAFSRKKNNDRVTFSRLPHPRAG
jgi:hypothetical protein